MAMGKPKQVNDEEEVFISINPDDAESGGLLDDVDAEITLVETCLFDYNGTQADPSPALHVQLKSKGGEVAEQYYTAGKLERVMPSNDGTRFKQAPGANGVGLSSSCNAFTFLNAMKEKGFPGDKLETDLTVLVGLTGHFNRVPQQKRSGLDSGGEEGKSRTILVVTKIIKMPWEVKGKTGVGGATSISKGKTGAAKKSEPVDVEDSGDQDELMVEAIEAVKNVLAEAKDSTMERKKIGMAVFKATADSENRAEILKLINDKKVDFFAQDDLPFVADDDTVTLSE